MNNWNPPAPKQKIRGYSRYNWGFNKDVVPETNVSKYCKTTSLKYSINYKILSLPK